MGPPPTQITKNVKWIMRISSAVYNVFLGRFECINFIFNGKPLHKKMLYLKGVSHYNYYWLFITFVNIQAYIKSCWLYWQYYRQLIWHFLNPPLSSSYCSLNHIPSLNKIDPWTKKSRNDIFSDEWPHPRQEIAHRRNPQHRTYTLWE